MSVHSGWEVCVGAQVGSLARFVCDVLDEWEACGCPDLAVDVLLAMAFATLFSWC